MRWSDVPRCGLQPRGLVRLLDAKEQAFGSMLRRPLLWAVVTYCAVTTSFLSYKWLQFYGINLHPDSMVYYAAARLALDGKITVLFNPEAMTDFVNSLFSPQLATIRLPFTPWLYPPIYLLA